MSTEFDKIFYWKKMFFLTAFIALISFNLPNQKAEANAKTLGVIGTALGGTALGLGALNTWALYRNGAFSPGYRTTGYYAPQFGYAGYGGGYGSGYYGYGGGYYSPSYYGGYTMPAPGGCGGPPVGCSMPVMMAVPCCQTTVAPVMASPCGCSAPPVGCSGSYGGFYR